jgi:calcineurin-like phosphoesterase family protein
MGAVWYTSDTHFMHKMLATDIRGFSGIEEHDEALIANWNKQVRVEDIVYHLGDFSLKKPDDIRPIFQRLNGTIHLISGNHDYCFSGNRDGYKYIKTYIDMGFASVQSYMRKRLNGIQFLMCHFPYAGDHGTDRYTQYRLRNEGLPIVHGHTHSDERISVAGVEVPQIHVGMDAWSLRLVHQEELLGLLESMQG